MPHRFHAELRRLVMSLIRKVGKHHANGFALVEKRSRHVAVPFVSPVIEQGLAPACHDTGSRQR
jgi:hypothetical protein